MKTTSYIFFYLITVSTALFSAALEQESSVVPGFLKEKAQGVSVRSRNSSGNLRLQALKRRNSLSGSMPLSARKKTFDVCLRAIQENCIVDDLLSSDVLFLHDSDNCNLLHYAALYQRPCIALLLLALEKKFLTTSEGFVQTYVLLQQQKNCFDQTPFDVAKESLSHGLLHDFLSTCVDEELYKMDFMEDFFRAMKPVNSLYFEFFVTRAQMNESKEDILSVLSMNLFEE